MNTANGGAREPSEQQQQQHQPFWRIEANQQLRIDSVLGLRCLSIVLSYLEECDGTSFLLSQKKYWTDTVLPCHRLPPGKGSSKKKATDKEDLAGSEHSDSNPENRSGDGQEKLSSKPTKPKHRHRFSRRYNNDNHAPLIKIPDASTRLDHLNTRRWNIRQRRRRKSVKTDGDGGEEEISESSCYAIHNTTTTRMAEAEWKETVTTTEDDGPIGDNNNHNNNDRQRYQKVLRHRLLMNPPLLQFYDARSFGGKTNEKGTAPSSLFQHGTTLLASYPRSGNTLLRSLLETVTGFVTASDTRPDRNLSVALAEKPPYFVGEGLAPPVSIQKGCSSTAEKSPKQQHQQQPSSHCPFLPPRHQTSLLQPPPPICKTHWPERIGCHSYDCQRVVLLVRNPFDAVDSYWHMCLTNTHTEKVVPTITEEHRSFYEALVRHEILQVWMSFLDYYWKECSKQNVPLLLVRYEDLVLSSKDELQRILEFCCCGSNNSKDSKDWWKRRLEEVTRAADDNDALRSPSQGEKSGDRGGSFKYGYRSSASTSDPSEETLTSGGSATIQSSDAIVSSSETSNDARCSSTRNNSTHPSIGRSLRKGLFSQQMLKQIHDFDDLPKIRRNNKNDDQGGGWLERLGYHIYKQGFPNNLDSLPPVPALDSTECCGDDNNGSLAINIQDVSLELRPRDSPYGRNMSRWRRKLTENDTAPFPTT